MVHMGLIGRFLFHPFFFLLISIHVESFPLFGFYQFFSCFQYVSDFFSHLLGNGLLIDVFHFNIDFYLVLYFFTLKPMDLVICLNFTQGTAHSFLATSKILSIGSHPCSNFENIPHFFNIYSFDTKVVLFLQFFIFNVVHF